MEYKFLTPQYDADLAGVIRFNTSSGSNDPLQPVQKTPEGGPPFCTDPGA